MIGNNWNNPNFNFKKEKIKEQSSETTNNNLDANINNQEQVPIITLDEIINKIESEYFNAPRTAIINGVPRNIEFEVVDLGKLMVKYEQFFKENNVEVLNTSIDDKDQSMGLAA